MEKRIRLEKALYVFCLLSFSASLAKADVLITEIMYNPPQGSEYEYIEIHNSGTASVDLSGWSFAKAVNYKFPPGTSIPAGAFLVVCGSREAFHAAYPSLPGEVILGPFGGSLSNDGERLTLGDATGAVRQDLRYDDDSPWDFLADGFGASLERVCFTASPDLPENWRASKLPASLDAFGGSPGAPNGSQACPPVAPGKPRVLISEIMYHPVLEEALEDYHEFVEVFNAGKEAVSLGGWRLAGGIDYTFPAGAAIAPGEYKVVAKDRSKLAAVAAYSLREEDLFGNYERTLDNGGDKVALIGADGQGIDSVSYGDTAPWPAGPDALGAADSWLSEDLLPLEKHRYLGYSLERVSFDFTSGEIANWAPSPLDGATPGRPNASARAVPLPVVAELGLLPATGEGPLIRADQEVLVQARFSPAAPVGAVEVEYMVDDVMKGSNGSPTTVPMLDDGQGGGDVVPGDAIYSAKLPGQPENTIVRYRIRADRGSGTETVSPRSSDPNPWNSYFVSPVIDTTTRVYQLFLSPVNWGRMWTNIQGGRASGCKAIASWDGEVPAVFVHEGQVFDVFVRYQGSRWNRTNGPTISRWTYPRPSTGPLSALSWHIAFPRYSQLEGKGALILNKLTQGCPGYNAGVGFRLFEMADLPACQTRFVRFHVNGGYYAYMIELERPGPEMMRRYHRDMAKKHPELPREEFVGHLFKDVGCNCDEGPFGWGDQRILNPTCGFSKEARYAATYDRKTNNWDTPNEFIRMIEDFHAARKSGADALRAYFAERFDLDLLLSYVAITNYSVPFDDMFQNQFLYQRISDGKWIIFPWDLDQNFGEWKGPNSSLYMGEQGNPDNRSGWWNYIKDAVLKSYREEFEDRLLELNNTILRPEVIKKLIDDVTAQANPQEAAKAPAGFACSFPGRASSFQNFAETRFALINKMLAGVELNAGPDQTVFQGAVVKFDASASKPAASPDVPYRWDNGMEGETPTFVFNEPGVHVVTLSVSVRGIVFHDSVTITVLRPPDAAFHGSAGQVVMEAESFIGNERHDSQNTWWDLDTAHVGFSGAGYMEAKEAKRQTFLSKYVGIAPELQYAIVFDSPGTYRVWIRALSLNATGDSCFVGLDGVARDVKLAQQFLVDPSAFLWSGSTRSEPQLLTVTEAGLHEFSIWIRESGEIIDKIILTKDLESTPSDAGPPESEKGPVGGRRAFIRGDARSDSKINVADALAILFHLFNGVSVSCEDYADVDDNGSVQVTDAIVLLAYLFQRGPAPAQPFPAAGYDTTADGYNCGDP